MKKFIVLFMMVLAMMSCADSKTFERVLIDANDGRDEEYTSLEDVPEDTLMDVVYHYLDGVIESITYDEVTIKKL